MNTTKRTTLIRELTRLEAALAGADLDDRARRMVEAAYHLGLDALGGTADDFEDASDLLIEDDPAPLPRFHLDGVDETPFDLVRVAGPQPDDATAPWTPPWLGLGAPLVPSPCLPIGTRHGATGGRQ